MAETLAAQDIPSTDVANTVFGGQDNGVLQLRVRAGRCVPWITVPEGTYAIVTYFGQEKMCTDGEGEPSPVWGPGQHWVSPFHKVEYLVTKQHVVYNAKVRSCKTSDNVTVEIDTAVVFRIMGDEAQGEDPELVREFIHKVTPHGLQQQLMDAMDEACRALARTMRHYEVYGLRSADTSGLSGTFGTDTDGEGNIEDLAGKQDEMDGAGVEMIGGELVDKEEDAALMGTHDRKDVIKSTAAAMKGQNATEKMRRRLNKQFKPQGIDVEEVMITDVKLPQNIQDQMTNKTMVISANAEQRMNQQYEMQQLRYNEELATLEQSHQEEREKERVEGQKAAQEVQNELESLKAEGKKLRRKIQEENMVAVHQIEAEQNLQASMLKEEENKILTELNASSAAEATELNAECDLYCRRKAAEARLEAARNDAKAEETLADAEGRIAPMLEAYKDFETEKKQLAVYQALSENPELVISAEEDPNITTMLVCDSILTDHASRNQVDRSTMLAELLVMSKGASVAIRPQDQSTTIIGHN